MSFFSKVRERIRDHGRDKLCAALQALGIQAQMSERGRPEEEIYASRRGDGRAWVTNKSSGVIDVAEGPIRWVNFIRARTSFEGDIQLFASEYLVYGVPDPKVRAGFPEVRLYNYGLGVRWEGEDFGLGILDDLNENVLVPTASLESLGVFEIRAYPDLGCWVLTVEDVLTPSRQEWDCYQAIASHLLGTPLPTEQ